MQTKDGFLLSLLAYLGSSALTVSSFSACDTRRYGGRIAQVIEAAGCQIVYLPPYSPDLNRIEQCWAWLKSRIRDQLHQSNNLRDVIELVLKQAAS